MNLGFTNTSLLAPVGLPQTPEPGPASQWVLVRCKLTHSTNEMYLPTYYKQITFLILMWLLATCP